MEEQIKDIKKTLYGNGQKGLCERMTIVECLVKSTNEDVSLLATSYSAMAKTMLENDITERFKAENRKRQLELKERVRKTVALLISIVAILTPITALIINITK